MAFKREVLDVLLARLNISGVRTKDIPLYEVIAELIKQLRDLGIQVSGSSSGGGGSTTNISNIVNQFLSFEDSVVPNDSEVFIGSASSGSSTSGDDYVVLSDGGLPTPLPVDDGAGNFIYVPYTP